MLRFNCFMFNSRYQSLLKLKDYDEVIMLDVGNSIFNINSEAIRDLKILEDHIEFLYSSDGVVDKAIFSYDRIKDLYLE